MQLSKNPDMNVRIAKGEEGVRHGKLNCPEKDIWCIWTDLQTGQCQKKSVCKVGTQEWKEEQRRKEAAVEASRKRAAEARLAEERQQVKPRPEQTERQVLTFRLQEVETRMSRCYKQGRVREADALLWESVKLKRKLEVTKNGKK